jgi:opacity protein-like surface antigen
MKGRILAIAALALVVADGANAMEIRYTNRTRRWDFNVQTRYTDAKDFEGKYGTNLALEDDLGWGFGFGYNLNERFNLGFLMSWRSIAYTATYFDATDLNTELKYGGWLDTGTFGLMGSWYIFPNTFSPYINGGVGWTMIDTNIVADYYTGCWWDPWWGYICNGYTSTYGTDAASFALGAGIRLEPTPVFFIQVGYEKNWIDVDHADGYDVFRVDVGITN